MDQPQIAVIGAGITGLALARLLSNSVVYEKSPFIGGPSRTIHYNGFHFDIGLHWLFRLDPEVELFIQPFIGKGLLEIPFSLKSFAFVKNGRTFPVSSGPTQFPFFPDPFLASALKFNYYFRRVFPKRKEDYETFLVNRHGDLYYWLFVKAQIEKNTGQAVSQIFIPNLPVGKKDPFLIRLIRWILRGRRIPQEVAPVFSYPLPWFGVLVEGLADGIQVRCRSELTQIHFSKNRAVGIEINGKETFSCDHLVLATSPHLLVHLFNPPDEIRQRAKAIRYRSLIYVVLFFKTARLMDKHLIGALGKEIFWRAFEPKNWEEGLAPPGETFVCFEIPCFQRDNIWKTPDNEIVDRVLHDFHRYYPSTPQPSDRLVFRIPHVFPQFVPSLMENLKAIQDFISSFENVYFPSDNSVIKGNNVNTSIKEAFQLERKIRAEEATSTFSRNRGR